jgi:hypothetical protein
VNFPDRGEIAAAAPGLLDALRKGLDLPYDEQVALVRLVLALELTLWEGVWPKLCFRDMQRFDEDPTWRDGWDAAMDFVSQRIDLMLSTIDESGEPWPDSGGSFKAEMEAMHRDVRKP